jgi:uncharacterized protein (TIGR03437 family)
MRTFFAVCFGCLVLSGSLPAQAPTITSVQNPASNILPGLPNFGIAQGSIMIVYGTNFGPTTLAEPSALPWPILFAGTSVTVTQGSSVYNVPIIYVLNNQTGGYSQLAGIMPSNTTPGNATVTLTYNGVASQAFATTIVANNFGISTGNESGQGIAVITYPTSTAPFYGLVSRSNSAIPGNTYTMWGTGLGAATGGNTDTNVNVSGNVGPPVTVLVGGIAAAVPYYGRSPGAGPGLDQINFTIPAGLSGCFVSLVVQTSATLVSNMPSIPVAANGGLCSDPAGFPTTTWPPLMALPGGIDVASFQMNQSVSSGSPPIYSEVKAGFFSLTQSQLASNYVGVSEPNVADDPVQVSPGSCVIGFGGPSNLPATPLDAGPALTVIPPTGSALTVPPQSTFSGAFKETGTSLLPSGIWTVNNGAGGANVGPITSSFTVPPFATWSNQNALANSSVTRSNGLTVTWSGGSSSGGSYIDIQGSAPYGTSGNDQTFECAAPIAAGTFTIPPSVLLALPAGGGGLQFGTYFFAITTAPGFNLAYATGSNVVSIPINWK